jgi:hypothetical protein
VIADDLVWEITHRAWRFGVSVLLQPTKTVDCEGFGCGGYFDEESKTLAVATDRSEQAWLGVLVHEYCHLTQWAEDAPVWLAADKSQAMWDWLDRKPARNVQEVIRRVQDVEADCERRAIRLIREMAAPVDLDRYTRTANAYIHFHNVIADKRKWYRPDVVMADTPSLLAAANATFDRNFSKTPKALREQLERII